MSIDESKVHAPADALEVTVMQDMLVGAYNPDVSWQSPRSLQELFDYAGPAPEAR